MSAVVETPPKLITAEEFLLLPDRGWRRELVKGIVVTMNPPGFRHGEVCSNVHHYVDNFVRQQQIGRTLTNDSGVITARDPDSVRGPDISYYSYRRVPKGLSPVGYAGISPEIVFEVVSPTNTRPEITTKIGEYLQVRVNVVCVVDPQFQTVNLHFANRPTEKLQGDDPLVLEDLPGFSQAVRVFFE